MLTSTSQMETATQLLAFLKMSGTRLALNADGQSKVQEAANGNYTLTADDFKTGTFTITAKSTTQNDATTEVTADSQTITFGNTPRAFTATFGDKLSHVTLRMPALRLQTRRCIRQLTVCRLMPEVMKLV